MSADIARQTTSHEEKGCNLHQIPFILKKHHIIRNYKKLKEELEPNEMLDYLVQYGILDTEENTVLLHKCRAEKCDFILYKIIKEPDCLNKFVKILNDDKEAQSLYSFRCFRSLLRDGADTTENQNSDVKCKSSYF